MLRTSHKSRLRRSCSEKIQKIRATMDIAAIGLLPRRRTKQNRKEYGLMGQDRSAQQTYDSNSWLNGPVQPVNKQTLAHLTTTTTMQEDLSTRLLDTLARFRYEFAWVGTFVTWVFALLVVCRCSFMYDTVEMGLFSKAFFDQRGQRLGCVRYGLMFDPDPPFRAGRTFGMMACLCSSVALACFSAAHCHVDRKCLLWNIGRNSLLGSFSSEVLSFIAVGSNLCPNGCTVTGVGALALFNVVALLVLLVGLFHLPPPTKTYFALAPKVRDGAEQTSTEVSNPSRENGDETLNVPIQSLPRFRFALIGLLGLAFSLSVVGVSRCSFARVHSTVGPFQGQAIISTGLGLFSQAVDDHGRFLGCVSMPSNSVADRSLKASQFFGVLASGLAAVAVVVGVTQLFIVKEKLQQFFWASLRVILPASCCSHLLIFTMFASLDCRQDDSVHCRVGRLWNFFRSDQLINTVHT